MRSPPKWFLVHFLRSGLGIPYVENKTEASRNARLGLWLFGIYLVFYAGFVLISAFATEAMEWVPFAGLNLAVVYGFGLIILAIVLSLVYGWLCRTSNQTPRSRDGGK